MNLLLDTHTFLWWDTQKSKIPALTLAHLEDKNNVLLLSLASVWEIQIKTQLGKLKLRVPSSELIAQQQEVNGLQILPITLSHIFALEQLPAHHKDPFDRLLIAQASSENLICVSADPMFNQYSVSLLW
jgi:PIN domain nuclease of toxin-antitoxin system